MRWILIEEIVEIRKGRRSLVRSRVPSSDVFPGFLAVEMMAQTGGLLLGLESDFSQNLVFAKIDSVTFLKALEPGDLVEVEAWSDQLKSEGAWIQARVIKDSETAVEGTILLMNAGPLLPGRGSITFHRGFMDHYSVRSKIRHD